MPCRSRASTRLLLAITVMLTGCSCSLWHSAPDSPSTVNAAPTPSPIDRASSWTRDWAPDSNAMMNFLREIASTPHPMGSPRQRAVGDLIASRARELGYAVWTDEFDAIVPNPDHTRGPATRTLKGRSILAMPDGVRSRSCVVLLASHYDTKLMTQFAFVGANDSGSSTVAILEALRGFAALPDDLRPTCDVGAIWFDGEEATLEGWSDGEFAHPARLVDHTYGSRRVAARLVNRQGRFALPDDLGGRVLGALILLDMVGSPNIVLNRETNSTPALLNVAINAASSLGYTTLFSGDPQSIEDDHVPFLQRGVPAIDMIDFVHTSLWHTPKDTIESISPESLVIATKTALLTAIIAASAP